MENSGRIIVQTLYRIPLLGHLARIVVGLAKLPGARAEIDRLGLQASQFAAALEALNQRNEQLSQRNVQLNQSNEQLDDQVQRLGREVADLENLKISVPVALRQSARDLALLRSRIASRQANTTLGETP